MSIAQPSAAKIADLYQGNPQVLQQRIAKEPKGPTGLPLDLSKLMALNIDLTETDAAKRQEALNGLQQMQQQSPSGEMPTIAQSIQQQAEEKAKAMAVQQQRQQQGLQALMQNQGLMGAIPQQTPQPERQPSGIDELRANLGDNYASGGIVAFSGEDGSEVKDEEKKLTQYTLAQQGADWEARMQAARDAEEARGATSPAGDVARGLASLVKRGATAVGNAYDNLTERQRIRQEMEQNRPGLFEALTDQERADRKEKSKQLLGQLNQLVESKPAAEKAPVEATPLADIRGQLNAAEGRSSGLPAAVANAAAPAAAPRVMPNAASSAQAAGSQRMSHNVATPAAAVDPMAAQLNNFFKAAIEKTPAQQREEAINRMKEAYGAPDTAAQEKYIQQLEARRAAFAEPEDPYDRLRNYLRKAANAGGRTWQQTGAATSQAMENERLSNAQKDMEILKELMGESSKLADVKRGYKKELFGFGEKTYDDAFKTGLEVAKELKLDSRQAQLFAHQSAENALQRANAVKVAGMKGAEERMFDDIASDWLSKPENKGKTRADAYAAYKIMGSPAAGAKLGGVMSRDQAEDNVRKDLENMLSGPKMIADASAALKAQGIQNPTSLQIKDYLVQQQMTKPMGGAPVASSGKVPALPTGFKLD